MRALLFCALLAMGTAAAGCSGASMVEPPEEVNVVRMGPLPERFPADRAAITRAVLDGDELVLDVEHSGGCAEHDFALYAGGFRESEPVQTVLHLAHDAHGDPCRALVRRELRFHLGPLQDAYRRSYGRGGTLVLQVAEPGVTPPVRHTVKYTC
jgi:hypothetical protein